MRRIALRLTGFFESLRETRVDPYADDGETKAQAHHDE